MVELTGSTALVTGAGSGIGRAVALMLAREGASVVATDLDEDAARQTAEAIDSQGGSSVACRLDVRSAGDHVAAVALATSTFGGLHIAVNNAGMGSRPTPLAEIDPDFWSLMLDVNLTGVFLGLRAQIPAIVSAGGGSVVNVASILAMAGRRGAAAYVAAKHGVVGLTRAAALDYAAHKVRINAVGPGFVRTPMIGHMDEAPLIASHPWGRLGRPEDIAEMVGFLVSPRADFVTGAYFPVDGGYLAQ
jgi:NAD(P)-dependent dehydrogenase (short-subunit alcohol dehydrogenase family)